MTERFKVCTRCNNRLPLTKEYFGERKNRKLGFTSHCRECDNSRKREYYKNNREKELQRYKDYVETENGKEAHRKSVKNFLKTDNGRKMLRQQRARRRNMGYNELHENILDEEIEWHHVDNENIVAIPKDLHQLYSGAWKYHREWCNEIVRQIYGDNDE